MTWRVKPGLKGKVKHQADATFAELPYNGPGTYKSDKREITFPGTGGSADIYGPELTPEERAKYCMIQVEQEKDRAIWVYPNKN